MTNVTGGLLPPITSGTIRLHWVLDGLTGGTKIEDFVSMANVVDIFGGGSADWARAVVGIQYTYLIELRDAGARGFQLPVDEIVPTGIENWAGLRELAAHVLLNHGWRRRPTATAVSASLLPASASTHDRRRTLCWTSASDRCRCRRPLLIIAAILLCVFLQHPQRSRRPETWLQLSSILLLNPLICTGNYSAILNNMKLVHWPLMGGLLRLVQRWRDWAGP